MGTPTPSGQEQIVWRGWACVVLSKPWKMMRCHMQGTYWRPYCRFVKHRTLDDVLNLHTWDTTRYSRLLLQSGIMHILETYQQGKKEGHKPRTRGEICKPTNVWFQHKSDYGWAGNSYRSCATHGSCHQSDPENVKILYELNGLVRKTV